ncbi:MAG: hypothetical protein QM726_15105 [Chitinophagaceae bacterium]
MNRHFFSATVRVNFYIVVTAAFIFSGCTASKTAQAQKTGYGHHKLLLKDEGLSQLAMVDLSNPSANWYVPVPAGRDMQLVGNGRVLIGTGNGYEEHELATGKKVFELTTYPGTQVARRLRNGNTLLTGVNWQDKKGIVLVEVDGKGAIVQTVVYPGFDYARLVRETASGNYLITANNVLFEGNKKGEIVWKATIGDAAKMHAWQALRLANGNTVVSTGYDKKLGIFNKDGNLLDSITGPAEVNPTFFSGFQILSNGNYIVANWQGHGPKWGASGVQVVEYTPKGKLAWSWKQDAEKFSSLQSVLVLDDLNPDWLYVEDGNGKLAPVK